MGSRWVTCLASGLVAAIAANAAPVASAPPATPADSAPAPRVATKALRTLQVVKLASGNNAVDLDGDGAKDSVIVGTRLNHNAHDYDVVSFYRLLPQPGRAVAWELMPLFAKADAKLPFEDVYRTYRGADCVLDDLRVLRPRKPGPVVVVTAHRAFGKSFADTMPVTFRQYEVAANTDGAPGWPTAYFQEVRQWKSARPHCDVGEAFTKELGVGAR